MERTRARGAVRHAGQISPTSQPQNPTEAHFSTSQAHALAVVPIIAMLEALCRQSSTTLDIVHADDGLPITQRTSGLVDQPTNRACLRIEGQRIALHQVPSRRAAMVEPGPAQGPRHRYEPLNRTRAR